MKRILHACLLVPLQWMSTAQAFEADIHYSTTYVLARAVGWSSADARVIASANEGVDENQHTVAALEVDTISSLSIANVVTSSFRQAEKNLELHCFSKTRGQGNRIAADVVDVMSRRFAEIPDRHADPRGHARRLIALGVALHCLQDAYAHVDFGGSCGPYAGSCYGHTHHNIFDQLAFRLWGKHLFNPDHPGVSGEHLLETLRGTARELASRLPETSSRPIPAQSLVALSEALRKSGLELPDDVRRQCNRYLAGKWLADYVRSAKGTESEILHTLATEVADACNNRSLAQARVVTIPDPRFPRLNADASPYLVRADGSYQLVDEGDAGNSHAHLHSASVQRKFDRKPHKVQLSHWSQVLALPLVGHIRSASAGSASAKR